ncbi:MAG: RidA family protein, partial [Verrucomicrobiota bacterium]|nr:RidA family protein [Verrucomicrobiota bacterium]
GRNQRTNEASPEQSGGSAQGSGIDYDNVVRATVYVSDMNNFQSMNSAYKGYFNSPHPPARSTVEFQLLRKGTLVEIDLIATE